MMGRTIARPVELSGVGLHSGMEVAIRCLPAVRGLEFVRTDVAGRPTIPAGIDWVSKTERSTTLGRGAASVGTVEHLLAAVSAVGLTALRMEVDGPEVPILDGSSLPFLEAMNEAGYRDTPDLDREWRVTKSFQVVAGMASYAVKPSDSLVIDASVEWDHPVVGTQRVRYAHSRVAFRSEVAGARAFGFLSEYDELKERGLALGASPENVIILDEADIVNGPLRWPDEFARHKIIDMIGDLALLGGRVSAEIIAQRPSHEGNVKLAEEIAKSQQLDAVEIMKIMPHRYPLLLVDRILEVRPGERVVGIKNVTINEPFFQGHFPGHPVMPGVLIVEAMAQAGGMLLMGTVENPEDKVVYFMSLDNVKFRRPVVPGDQLRLELEMVKFRGKTCQMKGVALVEGKPVAEAEMMARIVDR